jgi:DNA invertase Pin-like site-specific DNA recombinase
MFRIKSTSSIRSTATDSAVVYKRNKKNQNRKVFEELLKDVESGYVKCFVIEAAHEKRTDKYGNC